MTPLTLKKRHYGEEGFTGIELIVFFILFIVFIVVFGVIALIAQALSPTPEPIPTPLVTVTPAPITFSVVSVEEQAKTEVPLPTVEEKIIDNFESSTPTERKISVSHKWSFTQSFSNEVKANLQTKLGITDFSPVVASAQAAIKTHYEKTVSTTEETTQTEELTVTVPANAKTIVQMHWKQIWAKGLVKMRSSDGREFSLPFEACVALTFDQKQVEEFAAFATTE